MAVVTVPRILLIPGHITCACCYHDKQLLNAEVQSDKKKCVEQSHTFVAAELVKKFPALYGT